MSVEAELTADDFARHRNTIFTVCGEGFDPVETTLIEVDLIGSAPAEDEERRHAFSIVLRCPTDSYMPQQIYQVKHEIMGELTLFLVPIGLDKEGMRFEAVFT